MDGRLLTSLHYHADLLTLDHGSRLQPSGQKYEFFFILILLFFKHHNFKYASDSRVALGLFTLNSTSLVFRLYLIETCSLI